MVKSATEKQDADLKLCRDFSQNFEVVIVLEPVRAPFKLALLNWMPLDKY